MNVSRIRTRTTFKVIQHKVPPIYESEETAKNMNL